MVSMESKSIHSLADESPGVPGVLLDFLGSVAIVVALIAASTYMWNRVEFLRGVRKWFISGNVDEDPKSFQHGAPTSMRMKRE